MIFSRALREGVVSCSRAKTRFGAETDLWRFAYRNPLFYFWSFTFAEDIRDKSEADRRFKPFHDLLNRRGIEAHWAWELTKKGRWHLHMLVNRYLDVNWLRPWLMARGWGEQMEAERVEASPARFDGRTWRSDEGCVRRRILYLLKYVTKGIPADQAFRCKTYGATKGHKAFTTQFKWMPDVKPGAYLYYWGKRHFAEIYGHPPTFLDMDAVIRLGVEVTNWLEIDPWWMPSGP